MQKIYETVEFTYFCDGDWHYVHDKDTSIMVKECLHADDIILHKMEEK